LKKRKRRLSWQFTKIDKTGDNFEKARNDLMATGVLLEGFWADRSVSKEFQGRPVKA